MIRRPPRSTQSRSSAASDVYKRQLADLPRGVVVVTGTNGKTTTTKMLVAILREHGLTVFSNPTGSNFTRGVISSMMAEVSLTGRLRADLAVLELDEAHALKFTAEVKPTHASVSYTHLTLPT